MPEADNTAVDTYAADSGGCVVIEVFSSSRRGWDMVVQMLQSRKGLELCSPVIPEEILSAMPINHVSSSQTSHICESSWEHLETYTPPFMLHPALRDQRRWPPSLVTHLPTFCELKDLQLYPRCEVIWNDAKHLAFNSFKTSRDLRRFSLLS